MKCQNCSREIKLWQATCPYCRNRMPPKSYSTITEAPETLEQHSRRRLLQRVLQFSLVAMMFIALASLIRFNPPKASPRPPENLRAAVESSPVAVSVAESPARVDAPRVDALMETPVASEPEPAPVVEPQTLSLFSAEDLRLAGSRTAPATIARPMITAQTTSPKTPRTAAASTDEALPKKIATPIAPSGSVATPAAAVTIADTDPKLEVESAGVSLYPNTGLVTIKSYVPARIYIDGVYSGSTPRSVKLLAGDHTISLLASGYHEYSRKVKISGQQQLGILASMSKK